MLKIRLVRSAVIACLGAMAFAFAPLSCFASGATLQPCPDMKADHLGQRRPDPAAPAVACTLVCAALYADAQTTYIPIGFNRVTPPNDTSPVWGSWLTAPEPPPPRG